MHELDRLPDNLGCTSLSQRHDRFRSSEDHSNALHLHPQPPGKECMVGTAGGTTTFMIERYVTSGNIIPAQQSTHSTFKMYDE